MDAAHHPRDAESATAAHTRLHAAFLSGETQGVAFRLQQLRALQSFLHSREAEILHALHLDLRRPAFETQSVYLPQLHSDISFFVRNLRGLCRAQTLSRNFLCASTVEPCAKGAVAIFAPSNFPIFLALRPLVAALAAGCCVLLKPSEHAPASEALLATLLRRALDPLCFAVVCGHADVAARIADLPWDHIFFTGSATVGRLVMRAAAAHLTPLTLELGGKNPAVVLRDAHLPTAAHAIARSRFLNSGQLCLATDYCLVAEEIYDQFADALVSVTKQMFGEDARQSPNFGRLLPRNFTHVQSLLRQSRGRVLLGGQHDEAECYMAPTIVAASSDDALLSEEIFGPVLPIVRVSSAALAMRDINGRPHPLAIYVFSRSDYGEVVRGTRSGSVCVNDTMLQVSSPGGFIAGVGDSGMGGGCGGREGFDVFTHRRCVLVSTPELANLFTNFTAPQFVTTWYGRRVMDAVVGVGVAGLAYGAVARVLGVAMDVARGLHRAVVRRVCRGG